MTFRDKDSKFWRRVGIVAVLLGINLFLGKNVVSLEAADEMGPCKICWCATPGGEPPMGTCSSIGTGRNCGTAQGGTGLDSFCTN